MADGSPAGPPDGLTPREEEVRRLLADARHTGPMPDEVAGRLDRVLAGLAADAGDERGPTPAAAATPVASLASARRRRATTMLVAAAAVVAVGVGLGQVVGDGLGPQGADESAVSSAQEGGGTADRQVPGPAATSSDARGSLVETRPLPVDARSFAADVRRIREEVGPLAADGTPKDSSALSSVPAGNGACDTDRWGVGTFVPVRYERHPGVLVFRAPRGDSQVVDLFGCGSPDVLRSVTLPAP